jgi:DNA-binding MarR family transcriptional regulator
MCPGMPSRSDRIRRISGILLLLMWFVGRRSLQVLQSFGLTPPQFMALFALSSYGEPRTMSYLTTATLHDAPTMTGIIDRLEKAGLVERTRSDTDRRVVLVRATPSGLDVVCQVHERWLTDDVAGCAHLSDEDLAETEQLIRGIFRIHLGRSGVSDDKNLEEAMNKLELFLNDPIGFVNEHAKQEPWCVPGNRSAQTAA